jgi:outer membrane protein OmpA-like peptidoglycan-associated protein/opacity protein-like surface antigen
MFLEILMKLRRDKVKRAIFTVACGALALPLLAQAGEGLYIGVEGGLNFEGPQSFKTNGGVEGTATFTDPFKVAYIGGLTVGYGTSIGLRPELEYAYRRNDFKSFSNIGIGAGFESAHSVMANLWYDFKLPEGYFSIVHPYIGGGIGSTSFAIYDETPRNDYDIKFAYQGGAGVGVDLTPNLKLSVGWRYLQTNLGDVDITGSGSLQTAHYRAQSVIFGLQYSFGEPALSIPAPEEPPVQVIPVQEPPPLLPPPPPADSDGDGVPDYLDHCPGTPHGFKVDASGCIIEQTVVLRAVDFEVNSDQLTMPSQQTLTEVAAALSSQPALRVQINGYTDATGSPAYNLRLSQKRAESVRRYLADHGVAPGNLLAKGFGKASPIASNDSEDGRAQNRRVEFVVLSQPFAVKVLDKGPSAQSEAAAEGSAPVHHHAKHKAPAPVIDSGPVTKPQ